MEILFSEDESNVRVHSSIDQYKGFLSVYSRGGWTPIEFDQIDYIECIDCDGGDKHRVVSHPIIVAFDDPIGYHFPVGECSYITDEYPLFDREGIELRKLPEEQGDGFYQVYNDDEIVANFDNAGLGIRNNWNLKIGQDYYLADEILPSDDEM